MSKKIAAPICKICKQNQPIPRFAICNQCRVKKIKENNNDSQLCSTCIKPFDGSDGYKTCVKCRLVGKNNRLVEKKIKENCLWINSENKMDICMEKVFKKNYCEKHYNIMFESSNNNMHETISDNLLDIKKEVELENQLEIIDETEELRVELIKDINKLLSYSQDKINRINKEYEIDTFQPLFDKSYYVGKIFNSEDWTNTNVIDKLDLELEIIPRREDCVTAADIDKQKTMNNTWDYLRIHTSSIRSRRNPGRYMRIFLKDKVTQKYLGILSIGNVVYDIKAINDKIGWDEIAKKKNIGSHIVNINCCVGLPPVSFNTNIGKLLAMSAFSEEIQEEYKRRYGQYIACYITFSIYGKSIQYDQLKCLKMLKEHGGLTKGHGGDIPDNIYNKGMKYLEQIGYDFKSSGKIQTSSRLRKTRILFKELGFGEIHYHNNEQRGIYFGYTSPMSEKLMRNELSNEELINFKPDMQSFKEIFEFWKNRWAYQRLKHLILINNYKTEFELLEHLTRKEKIMINIKEYQERSKKKLGIENYNKLISNYRKECEIYTLFSHNVEVYTFNQNKYEHFECALSDSYLGGLFDGDGSFVIYKANDSSFTINIIFAQSVVSILEILQSNFGGYIYKGRLKKNQRQQYSWRITGMQIKPLLDKLIKGCILKHEQALLFNEFYNLIGDHNYNKKLQLYKKLRDLNAKVFENPIKPYNNINMDYIIGIFDAEGCISISSKLTSFYVKITQKGDTNILYKIEEFLKCGKVYEYSWIVYDRNIINILRLWEPKSIVKKHQVTALITYLETYDYVTTGIALSDDIKEIRQQCYDLTQDEKHTSIDVDKVLFDSSNKLFKIKNDHKKITNNIQKNADFSEKVLIYKELVKLEKQTSNSGLKKTRSVEHETNWRKSITESNHEKRLLTDTQIKEILEMKKLGIPQTEMIDKYKVSRSVIYNVISGNVKPVDEITHDDLEAKKLHKDITQKIKASMSADEYKIYLAKKTSIGKRSLSVTNMIDILLLKGKSFINDNGVTKKWGAPNTTAHFKNIGVDRVTEDIVKNIWSGKTKLYHEEHIDDFVGQQITYEEYLDIIQN